MERRTLRYSISLIVCLCVALTLNAQVSSTNGTDKRPVAHKQEKKKDKDVPVYPLFNGVDLSVDLWGPGSYLLGSDNLSMEVAADVNLKNRLVGYGKSDTWSEDGIHYKTGAPYLRIGMDYNTFYKKKFQHKLLVGLRYAVSSFSYDVQSLSVDDPIYGGGLGNPNITDGIWGGNLPPKYAPAFELMFGKVCTWAGLCATSSASQLRQANMAILRMYPVMEPTDRIR